MNIRSARFRITAWYSISVSLATILIFISFFIVTQQTLYNRVDSELTSHGNTIMKLATAQGSAINKLLLSHAASDEFNQTPGMLVVALDPQGNIIQSSLSGDANQSKYFSIYSLSKQSDKPVFQNETIANTQMRFYGNAVRDNGQLIGVILVAHPIDVIQKSLTSLVTILGIVFIVLIIPMILGGYGMARGIMQPISELIEKLQKISSEHLHERIKNPRTGDEMEELVVTFNNLLNRLQNAFQRERQFIADVAHELKTPLATLQSGIEITLSKERNKEEYKEAMEETLIDARRQSNTLNKLLDLAMSDASTFDDGVKPVNLTELFDELHEVISKIAKQKDIIIEESLDKDIIVAGIGSKDRLARAFLNILENAVKYTPQNGKIKIILKKEQETAKIQVSDTGIGIAKEDLPHIFERFYRGSTSKKALGSGLGMAIAQSIINAHHGKIQVKSQEGKGTTVIVLLPIMNISS